MASRADPRGRIQYRAVSPPGAIDATALQFFQVFLDYGGVARGVILQIDLHPKRAMKWGLQSDLIKD